MKYVEAYKKLAEYITGEELEDAMVYDLMKADVFMESIFYIDDKPEKCLWHYKDGKSTVLVLSTEKILNNDQIEFGVQGYYIEPEIG